MSLFMSFFTLYTSSQMSIYHVYKEVLLAGDQSIPIIKILIWCLVSLSSIDLLMIIIEYQ